MLGTQSRFWRLGNPMLWGVGVTALLFGLAIFIGLQETCTLNLLLGLKCQTKFQYLMAATPNEFGDALSGFAGALAFIWIIVTVWLQSIELQEQRKVLELQKEEMGEQRKATQDMARSMSAQAQILEDEQRLRTENRAENTLNQRLSALMGFLEDHPKVSWSYLRKNDDGTKTRGDHNLIPWLFPKSEIDDQIKYFVSELGTTLSGLIYDLKNNEILSLPVGALKGVGLDTKLEQILSIKEDLSEAQRIRLESLGLATALHFLNELYELPVWNYDEQRAVQENNK